MCFGGDHFRKIIHHCQNVFPSNGSGSPVMKSTKMCDQGCLGTDKKMKETARRSLMSCESVGHQNCCCTRNQEPGTRYGGYQDGRAAGRSGTSLAPGDGVAQERIAKDHQLMRRVPPAQYPGGWLEDRWSQTCRKG